MPQIRSAVNGLIINIPADAAGVVGRFHTPGDNELIFDRNQPRAAASTSTADDTMKIADDPAPRTRTRTRKAAAEAGDTDQADQLV